MSTISPGELLSVLGASDPESMVEQNQQVLTRQIWKREPTYQNGTPNTVKGPPTTGAHVLDEFWRDSLGAEYVCITAGTPGTWKQIRFPVLSGNPTGVPTGYVILRSDLNHLPYYYNGSTWVVVVGKSEVGLGNVENLKVNLTATAAPTVNDDSGDGYAVGSRWFDVTNDREYVALDVAVGAAVWKETTATGGGSTPTGTGFRHVTGGTEDGVAKLVETADVENDQITNAKLANMATATFKGRNSAGTGDPEDLSATQATALLNNMVGDFGSGGTKGLAPAPAAGDAAAGKYLKADGTWAVPPGSGGGGITVLEAQVFS